MDCNGVFNVLTRGPFPSGSPQDAAQELLVEEHLERCHDCWRLAEAFRPAADLFHESIPPAESRDLPGYWGDATPPGVLVAQIARNATHGTRDRHRPQARQATAVSQAGHYLGMQQAPSAVESGKAPFSAQLVRVVTFVGLAIITSISVSWFLQ